MSAFVTSLEGIERGGFLLLFPEMTKVFTSSLWSLESRWKTLRHIQLSDNSMRQYLLGEPSSARVMHCLCPPALQGEMRSQYRGRGWWWWWGWGWGWVWRRSNAAAECLMWQLEIVRMRGDTELQRPRPRPVIQPRLSVSHSPRFQLCVLLCY